MYMLYLYKTIRSMYKRYYFIYINYIYLYYYIEGVPNSTATSKGDDLVGPNEQKIVWQGGSILFRLGARRNSPIFGLFAAASKLRVP